MVVFICETCFATLKKNQIDKHCETKCRNGWHFTCLECSKTFGGFEYKEHNECMTEVQRYQGKFIEKQRELKKVLKEKEKEDKEKKQQKKDNGGPNDGDGDGDQNEKEALGKKSLRRFLGGKKHNEFLGWSETG